MIQIHWQNERTTTVVGCENPNAASYFCSDLVPTLLTPTYERADLRIATCGFRVAFGFSIESCPKRLHLYRIPHYRLLVFLYEVVGSIECQLPTPVSPPVGNECLLWALWLRHSRHIPFLFLWPHEFRPFSSP